MELLIKKQIETLNRQIKELSSIFHSAAQKAGISDSEFWVWYSLLFMKGEHSQQDIRTQWSLPKQTVHSIVVNMMNKGFVFLETVPEEHHRKIIRLTEQGKRYGCGVISSIYNTEDRVISILTGKEICVLVDLLGKYTIILKEIFLYE